MGGGTAKKSLYTLITLPRKKGLINKRFATIFILLSTLVMYIFYIIFTSDDFEQDSSIVTDLAPTWHHETQSYLIHTSTCRIPNDDPFGPDVRKFFHPETYVSCSDKLLLSYVELTKDGAVLKINQSLVSSYSFLEMHCCYSVITRIAKLNESDNHIRISDCKPFKSSVQIRDDFIKVVCKNWINRNVYANVHAIVHPRQVSKTRKRKNDGKPTNNYSVTFVGIDSISKMNLVRALPKTWQFLEHNDFVNLKGYTKIGDNTLPNLFAILTGRSWPKISHQCALISRQLDDCDLIWKRFKELGYLTGYAEDEVSIATFQFDRKGFYQPPTDFYFRPYLIAAEQLPVMKRYGMTYCAGPETSGERVLNLAKDFVRVLKDYPTFGLFWMNSFSHDNLNSASTMDLKIEQFLKDIYRDLDHNILIVFSDHGFRFGDIRHTHTGWLEERLPFIYIYLPTSFREQHKQKYQDFLINSQRLTTPYDLYMTLQDILKIADDKFVVEPSEGCPKCQSLFKQVDEKRTCKDASIDQHWCVCTGHFSVDPNQPLVKQAADFIVLEINTLVRNYSENTKCLKYSLRSVVSAGMSEKYLDDRNQSREYFLLIIETNPQAMFEATVEQDFEQDSKSTFRLLGDISRVDRYHDNSLCVHDPSLKKYCYCDGTLSRIKSAAYSFFNYF